MQERVNQKAGLLQLNFLGVPPVVPGSYTKLLDYHETTLGASYNQILGRQWFLQAQYQFSRSELQVALPDIPASPTYGRLTTSRADLHEVRLSGTWQHPSGFFARSEFCWFKQALGGSTPQPDGDSFPEVNSCIGYRFPRRHGEFSLGVLNLTGGDYHLSPLNYYLELPHSRVFYTRFRFNF